MTVDYEALIFSLTVLLKIAVLVYVFRRIRNSAATAAWYMVYIVVTGVHAFANAAMATTTNTASFGMWFVINTICYLMMPSIMIVFTLHFINKEAWLRRFYAPILLALTPFTFLVLIFGTNSVFKNRLDFTGFDITRIDFNALSGPLFPLFILHISALLIFAIVLMGRYRRRLQDQAKRHETRLIIWGLLVPLVVSVAYQGVLQPALHLPFFAVAIPMSAISDIIIVYALTRYGLHIFNPADVTANLPEAIPGSLIILDHLGTVQFVNPGTKRLLKVEPNEVVGGTMEHFFSSDKAYRAFIKQVIEPLHDHPQTLEFQDLQLRNRAGKPVAVNLNATASYSDQKTLINVILVFTSIAELKQAQAQLAAEKAGVERKVIERTHELAEARAQLEASIRSLPFGFAIVTPDNEVVFSNKQLETLSNHPMPKELAASGEALADISRTFRPAINVIECLNESRRGHVPIEKHVELGPKFYRFFFVPIISDANHVISSVLIMEDTTEVKAQERSRDEFFSIASHELRTPLTAIRGNSDMMLNYYKDVFKDSDLKQMMGDIHESSVRLISIVNDFLDVSRLEQRNIQFKKTAFDPTETIETILREFDVTGSRKKLGLMLEKPSGPVPLVYADADRFRQILINLVSNAVKFTAAGQVTVTLAATGKTLKVAVTDTGRGIPVESQHLLFHKFQQAATSILTRDDTRSTGLGLYISKLLAEGMGGKLYLESTEVDKGSTFTLELPLTKAPTTPKS